MNPAPFDAACFRAGIAILVFSALFGVAALVVTVVTCR